jgi:hypothetical protein
MTTKTKRIGAMVLATLSLAGAALAAGQKFAGFLQPNQLRGHFVTLAPGQPNEIEVRGFEKNAAFQLRLLGAGQILKEKVSDDREVKMRFNPPTAGTFIVQVRNLSNEATGYELRVKAD